MQNIIEEFILQLHTKKDTSSNTEISYKRDLTKFFEYLNIGSIEEIKNITKHDLEQLYHVMSHQLRHFLLIYMMKKL